VRASGATTAVARRDRQSGTSGRVSRAEAVGFFLHQTRARARLGFRPTPRAVNHGGPSSPGRRSDATPHAHQGVSSMCAGNACGSSPNNRMAKPTVSVSAARPPDQTRHHKQDMKFHGNNDIKGCHVCLINGCHEGLETAGFVACFHQTIYPKDSVWTSSPLFVSPRSPTRPEAALADFLASALAARQRPPESGHHCLVCIEVWPFDVRCGSMPLPMRQVARHI